MICVSVTHNLVYIQLGKNKENFSIVLNTLHECINLAVSGKMVLLLIYLTFRTP